MSYPTCKGWPDLLRVMHFCPPGVKGLAVCREKFENFIGSTIHPKSVNCPRCMEWMIDNDYLFQCEDCNHVYYEHDILYLHKFSHLD